MAIANGTRLGPYEVISPVGAGGMGEVYRARDTRLGREVAIKLLPAEFVADAERRQRLDREARAIASLSHPHICTLYDVGHQDGMDFLVMEYLEGETLATRLERGALPTTQVVKIGSEIADALDRAHRKGIIHRDLKPANIILTKGGAKLLDFGLAKPVTNVFSGATAQTIASIDGTAVRPLTSQGAIVGTFHYMSPEQLEGREADARSDIWALGAVLYEMATGRRAFQGDSHASVIAAILTSEPPAITELKPLAPRSLDHAIRICLAKDPDERFQTAHDLKLALRFVPESSSSASAIAAVPAMPQRRWRKLAVPTLAIATALLLVAVVWLMLRPASPSAPTIRAFITPPANVDFQFTGDSAGPPAISRDGKRIVFTGLNEGQPVLYIRSLNETEAHLLKGTEGAAYPFWSPDGKSIGFFAAGKLNRIDADGGPVTALASVFDPRGGAWGDGVIAYTPDIQSGIFAIPDTGGTPRQVTQVDRTRHTTNRFPAFLPDGRHFVYLATNHIVGQDQNNTLYLASVDGGESRVLERADSRPQYASGYLLYVRESTLIAHKFDAQKLKFTAEPVNVSEVLFDQGTWSAIFSASDNGILIYQQAASISVPLKWFDRKGSIVGQIGSPDMYVDLRLSRDAKTLAFVLNTFHADLYTYDLTRGVRTRITFSGLASKPVWSPDDSKIAYGARPLANTTLANIAVQDSSGAGEPSFLLKSNEAQEPTDWSSDGKYIVFNQGNIPLQSIWYLPLEGDRKPVRLLKGNYDHFDAHLSPDAHWIAYASRESGREEIYLTSFPQVSGKWQVSANGGAQPRWRHDGKELYFVGPDGNVYAAAIKVAGSTLDISTPAPLFKAPVTSTTGNTLTYEVSPDGQRFLFPANRESGSNPIIVNTNWLDFSRK